MTGISSGQQNDQYSELLCLLKNCSGWLLLTDHNTRDHCRGLFLRETALQPSLELTMEPGERHKSLDTCGRLWRILTEARAGRDFVIVCLGGGVVSDIGGFVASTYKRGISYFNVPTTLLAMVDAATGGKTGINFVSVKNQIGSFYPPAGVLTDTSYLSTLLPEELFSGFAEMLKHGLIADDNHWHELNQLASPADVIVKHRLIKKSVSIKEAICALDPMEMNERKRLNFGHSIGHALESRFNEKAESSLKHGFAVAAGMICETYISLEKKLLSAADARYVISGIDRYFERLKWHESDTGHFLSFLSQDKKNKAGQFRFTLLAGIGKAVIDREVSEDEVIRAFKNYITGP